MPKTLLVSINAKFIHSNLAIRSIKAYTQKHLPLTVDLAEFTINQSLDVIMREIYKVNPDVIGFSCYIWNYEYVKQLVCEFKKLLPNCMIMLGGPEVSYNPDEVILKTGADIVMVSEGEKTFCDLMEAISTAKPYTDVPGIVYQSEGKIIVNEPAVLLNLGDIPFVYGNDFSNLNHRIVYYESSRGCPFKCQYCLSSGTGGVRFLPLERVFADLTHFLDANVRQVKFVDRTFNCDKKYSMAIWHFLSEHDNGITNFHFEVAAELLDDEMIAYLNTVRKGLFQLEIGVQSTNKETLTAIKRITLPEKLTPIIKGLQRGKNIHLHLDLIAGLPYENYDRFKNSFNYVHTLSPDQLQLGFLKLLKGSGLFADKERYGLKCTNFAPYEVVSTDWLSYGEILRLKMVEDMVETYYNSGRYMKSIDYLVSLFNQPFDLFEALGDYYEKNNLHLAPHSKIEYYDILFNFLKQLNRGEIERFRWLCLYDIYAHEKAKKLPEWLNISCINNYKNRFYDFVENEANRANYFSDYSEFDVKQIIRLVHFEVFPFHPISGEETETILLFRYIDNSIIEIKL
ncbi:MAG: B12-binding domain-containing radical SAM protein [Oscillospiraceae bacterium]